MKVAVILIALTALTLFASNDVSAAAHPSGGHLVMTATNPDSGRADYFIIAQAKPKDEDEDEDDEIDEDDC